MWIYFKGFLHFIMSRLVTVFFNFHQLNQAREMKYINVITWLLLCWLIFCSSLVFLTFFWRNIQTTIHTRNNKHLSRLEGDLILYLYDEKLEASLLEQFSRLKGYKRQIFLGLLVRMNTQFVGQLNNKLKSLFMETIHVKTKGEIGQYPWSIRPSYLRALSQMNIGLAVKSIEKLRASYNATLRTESLIAMTSIKDQFPFEYLIGSSEIISDWEQIHMHNNFVKYNAHLPDLSTYLTAENPSLIVFCLRLMRVFSHEEVFEELLHLLQHPIENVRHQTLLNLGTYKRKETLKHYSAIYPMESKSNKRVILKNISLLGKEAYTAFILGNLFNTSAPRLQTSQLKELPKYVDQGALPSCSASY